MDPRHSAQDVVRCALCRDAVAPMYCSVCHTHLCGDCVGKHFPDKVHNVVPLEQYLSTDFVSKKTVLERDLVELKTIFSTYKKSAVTIKTQKTCQKKNSEKLRSDIKKQGEILHEEIDTIIQNKVAEVEEMDKQQTAAIKKQANVIKNALDEIKQAIQDLQSLQATNNVGLVSKYTSRIAKFRKLPAQLNISFPNFSPKSINIEELLEHFGSFSLLSIETEEQGYTLPSLGAESSPPARPLLDVPRLITDIPTSGYEYSHLNVSYLSDEEIWTSGDNKIMKLYNIKGEVLRSVQTKSGKYPWDIAVTRSKDLVYTDFDEKSINQVKSTKVKKLIKLRGWIPQGLCTTSSDDILVIMTSDDDDKQTKVVRYSDCTEKQSYQLDDQGNKLYTSGTIKYLTENRNLDICVADYEARAVVVVSSAGKLRFRYTGNHSTSRDSFHPRGIITDSQTNILTSDPISHHIDIIDRDGHFLHSIHNCGLKNPWTLCVDSRDNLFVAEAWTGKVKKIQYYK